MSWLRYGFGFFLIIFGIVISLAVSGFPQGGEALEDFTVAIMIYAGGIGLFIWGFGRFRLLQLVRNTPTSKVRSMAKGNVEVKGDAYAVDNPLESPFSQQDCVYYKYQVQEYKKDDDGGDWRTVESGQEREDFLVDDGTGQALVEPDGANMHLPLDNSYKVVKSQTPPENIQSFLKENDNVDIQEDSWFSIKRKRRYREWTINQGESVYVYGYSERDTDYQGIENVIREGNAPMFFVSDKSEEELRDDLGTSYKLMIAGGILATVFGFLLMLAIG